MGRIVHGLCFPGSTFLQSGVYNRLTGSTFKDKKFLLADQFLYSYNLHVCFPINAIKALNKEHRTTMMVITGNFIFDNMYENDFVFAIILAKSVECLTECVKGCSISNKEIETDEHDLKYGPFLCTDIFLCYSEK